jgi:hypothetical protein
VEELHLSMRDAYPSLDLIHEALSGMSTPQCYPWLRCLTALSHHSGCDYIIEELKNTVEARLTSGGTTLEKLEFGLMRSILRQTFQQESSLPEDEMGRLSTSLS